MADEWSLARIAKNNYGVAGAIHVLHWGEPIHSGGKDALWWSAKEVIPATLAQFMTREGCRDCKKRFRP